MFKNIINNAKIILSLTALLLLLLTAFGCGDLNSVVTPQNQDVILGEVKSNSEVMAAPSNPKIYHGEGLIGPAGGIIDIHGSTKVIIPAGALHQFTRNLILATNFSF